MDGFTVFLLVVMILLVNLSIIAYFEQLRKNKLLLAENFNLHLQLEAHKTQCEQEMQARIRKGEFLR